MKRARPYLALLAVTACSDTESYEFEPYDFPSVGRNPVPLGDVDGDGRADLAITSTFRPSDGAPDYVVWIVSGRTGEARYGLRVHAEDDEVTARWPFAESAFRVIAAADVDGDGRNELAVALPSQDGRGVNEGAVTLLAGDGTRVLRCWHGTGTLDECGRNVLRIGDSDGDRVDDLAIVARGDWLHTDRARPQPRILLVSTRSGALLATQSECLRSPPSGAFGDSLTLVGDLDGDGVRDLVLGDSSCGGEEKRLAGSVAALSGRDARVLWCVEGERESAFLGSSLATIDDLDGDGLGDVLVSDYGAPAIVLSARTGARIPFPIALRNADTVGDLDGDERMDFAGVEGPERRNVLFVSGRDGSALWRVAVEHGYEFVDGGGAAGDVDGDGRADVLVQSDRDLAWRARRWQPDWDSLTVYSGCDGSLLHRFDRDWLAHTYAAQPPMYAPVCEHARR